MKRIIICCCIAAMLASSVGCTSKSDMLNDKLDEAMGKIDELKIKVDELSEIADEQEFGENYNYEDIHEIYDNTNVIEAYKTGDLSKLNDEDKYVLEQASKVIKKIIKDNMTDYEKEKAVYDYMYKTAQFDESSLSAIYLSEKNAHTPYGFFHDKYTICVGNATTFKLFMDMIGIENKLIHSTENGEHAWNVVKIDGDWYHVDITFDGGTEKPTYAFFNVTDEAKTDEYSWDKSEIPECTATKYSYPVNNAVKLKDIYDIPSAIKKALDSKKEVIYIKLPVPQNSDAGVFALQIRSLFNMLISDEYYINAVSAFSVDNEKSVVCTAAVTSGLNGDYNYSGLGDIDYSKLSEEFENIFDGVIEFDA